MIPENLNWPVDPYLAAGILLAIGLALAALGAWLRREGLERQRDQLYARRRRGEELPPADPPRVAAPLLYAGGVIVAIGVAVLLVAWAGSPGPA